MADGGKDEIRYRMLNMAVYNPSNPEIKATRLAVDHVYKISAILERLTAGIKKNGRAYISKI